MEDKNLKQRKRRIRKNPLVLGVIVVAAIVAVALGAIFIFDVVDFGTKERMSLADYYELTEDEVAVILNGHYVPRQEGLHPDAVSVEGAPYLEIKFLKSNIDDGYVYDSVENILRYVMVDTLITVKVGESSYLEGKNKVSFPMDIILQREGQTYINIDFVNTFTDFSYEYFTDPNRVVIKTAYTEFTSAHLSSNTAIRRRGGTESPILKDGKRGEPVWVMEDYGKWSKVVTDDGVIGCVKNSRLKSKTADVVPALMEERVYTHNLLDKKINMAWHAVYSINGNVSLNDAIGKAQGLNVISPTWYRISSNSGNISSFSSADYVNTCHARGIDVWPMVSNFEVPGVDSTEVLSRTSSRDTLVKSLISASLRDKVDGINIDFEALSIKAKDGFIQFIRELSLECKKNNLILSVTNYKPEAHTSFYNRSEQAKYADYIMVVAYDEYSSSAEVAGSNSSMPFAREAVEHTLIEVPGEQLLLALPFYARVWTRDGENLTNKAYGMTALEGIVNKAVASGAEKTWLSKEEQNYIKYEQNGKINEIWIEDQESLTRKVALVEEYNLAGASFWQLGFEPGSIWQMISRYIR